MKSFELLFGLFVLSFLGAQHLTERLRPTDPKNVDKDRGESFLLQTLLVFCFRQGAIKAGRGCHQVATEMQYKRMAPSLRRGLQVRSTYEEAGADCESRLPVGAQRVRAGRTTVRGYQRSRAPAGNNAARIAVQTDTIGTNRYSWSRDTENDVVRLHSLRPWISARESPRLIFLDELGQMSPPMDDELRMLSPPR